MNRRHRRSIVFWLVLLLIMPSGAVRAFGSAQEPPPDVEGASSAQGAVIVEPVAQIGGPVRVVKIHPPYAYIGAGTDFVILHVADPLRPTLVGHADLTAQISDIAVFGSYAYVISQGIYVLDINNVNQPRVVTHIAPKIATERYLRAVAAGGFLYVTFFDSRNLLLSDGGLRIFSLNNPASPVEISEYKEWATPAYQIVLFDRYAYVGTLWDQTVVLDVSNPHNPRKVGHVQSPPNSIEVIAGRYGYGVVDNISANISELVVTDLSDPARPQVISKAELPGVMSHVAVAGSYAYAVGEDRSYEGIRGTLAVVDISNPRQPRHIRSVQLSREAAWVAVLGSYVYIADEWSGIRIFDVRNPAQPQEVSGFPVLGQIYLSAADGNYLYAVGDRLWILDARRLTPFGLLATHDLLDRNPIDIAAANGRVYLLYEYPRRLEILDARNPTAPHRTRVITEYGIRTIYAVGHFLYAGGYQNGYRLLILDVSNPANPQLIGSTAMYAERLVVSGNYAYAIDVNRLLVVDVIDPTRPRVVGHVDLPHPNNQIGPSVLDLAAAPNRAYVLQRAQDQSNREIYRILIVDTSRPDAPRIVGSYDLRYGRLYSQVGRGIAASGSRLYALDTRCSYSEIQPPISALRVFDASQPTGLREVASLHFQSCAWHLSGEANAFYVHNARGDTVALRIRELSRSLYLPLVMR
ncbi:MAG: hypothetical protein RMK32_04530 [Anaerolineae bacterium]|nr:hypothetical protein [Anaerolineae bacterium]